MLPRPAIFISAVSRELHSARQLVANTLTYLGYAPEWQEIFGTEQGDLREMLRRRIDACTAVVQLVGNHYGAEPASPDEEFGRVSYTQYEALYARRKNKKVWYFFLDENFAADVCPPEDEDLRQLQQRYRDRVKTDLHLYHPLATSEGLETRVLKLRDELKGLRRGVRQWAVAVVGLLLFLAVVGAILLRSQARQTRELAEMREIITQFAQKEAVVRQAQPAQNDNIVRDRVIADLARQYGLDPKIVAEKLPRLAEQLKESTEVPAFERASAAYVAKDYAEAERLAEAAGREGRQASPPRTAEAVRAFTLAALSAQARLKFDEALRHLDAVDEIADQTGRRVDWARSHTIRAVVFQQLGQFGKAEETLREVLPIYESLGAENRESLEARNNLAAALLAQGKNAEAEKEFRELFVLQSKILGPEHPDTLRSRSNRAATLVNQGKYAEAEKELREVFAKQQETIGPENSETLQTRHNLAATLDAQGKFSEAEKEFRAVVNSQLKLLGSEHPQTLNARSGLAGVLSDQGKYAEAEKEFRTILARQQKSLGPEHPDVIRGRGSLAGVLAEQDKYAEAESEYRSVIRMGETTLGAEHPETLRLRSELAGVLIDEGKLSEAEHEYQQVVALLAKVEGVEHPQTLQARARLGDALKKEEKYSEAEQVYRTVSEAETRVLGPTHPETLRTRAMLGQSLQRLGRSREGISIDQESVALIQKQPPTAERSKLLSNAYLSLSWQQLMARDFAGALASSDAGLQEDPSNLSFEANRAHALLLLNRSEEAQKIYLEYRGQEMHPGKTWNETILNDFNELEKAGIRHPMFDRLRQVLGPGTKSSLSPKG